MSMKFSLLIKMKMPTEEKISCSAMLRKKKFAIASNLRFISRTNFMLSCDEHEKSFITLVPDLLW